MNCTNYDPWISRYVDEDLEGEELERLLEHLSGCARCRRGVEELERLRGWLHVADLVQGPPPFRAEWNMEELLRDAASPAEAAQAGPTRTVSGDGPNRPRLGVKGWIRGFVPFRGAPSWGMLRFALPLLVVALAVAWFSSRRAGEWIDVRELPSLRTAGEVLHDDAIDDVGLYVMQHARHQPWEPYGDELPMIELASTSSR